MKESVRFEWAGEKGMEMDCDGDYVVFSDYQELKQQLV